MEQIEARIGGKAQGPGSSYMQDKFMEVMGIPEDGPVQKGEPLSPREQAELKLHKNAKGQPIIPAVQIYAALMNAGIFHKIGKKQVSTNTSSMLPGGLFIVETELPIKHTKPWEVDSRSIVTRSGRIIKHRPRFDDWEVEFTLEVDTNIFSKSLIRTLLDDAGKRCGIGSYRPLCKGPFGRFVVLKWKEQKMPKAKKKAA